MAKTLCKICGEVKTITYAGQKLQYPVFYCSFCDRTDKNEWEAWYNEYKNLWSDKKNWDNKNGVSCIVGYFCNLYKKYYDKEYAFSYGSPNPYIDKDFLIARKLLTMFDGEAFEVGLYIKWMFEFHVKNKKKKITSMGFLTIQNLVNDFKLKRKKAKQIKRISPLPKPFIDWCSKNYPDIFSKCALETWNDLNGLITYVSCWKNLDDEAMEKKILKYAVETGLLESPLSYKQFEE